MAVFYEYNREAAVSYARRWALGRNPAYMDYELWGGAVSYTHLDNVEDGIKQYRDNSVHKEKIEYYSQKNQDQLNACLLYTSRCV